MKIKTAVLAALVALVAGCGSSSAATQPTPPTPIEQGQPFLPVFLAQLWGQAPPDNACHPKTLADMMIPCDKP